MALPRIQDSREGFRKGFRNEGVGSKLKKQTVVLLTDIDKKNSPCILNCREGHQNPFGLE
jgi:hypothetical protein